MELQAKLEAGKSIDESTGCWNWKFGRSSNGYGEIWVNKQVLSPHRVAAHLYLGLDLYDSYKFVCHKCNNPRCFNPEHLYLGTNSSNQHDRFKDKTHCINGHELTPQNTYYPPRKSTRRNKECCICRKAAAKRYYAKKMGV